MKSIRLNIDDLGILKKINQQEATKRNLNIISVSLSYIPIEVIVDGKILENNLKKLNISKAWINKRLKDQGIYSVEEVFYGEIQSDGSLYIDLKNNQIK